MKNRFCIARPSFHVTQPVSVREQALPDRRRTEAGFVREEFVVLLQPHRASAMRWTGDFRAGFGTGPLWVGKRQPLALAGPERTGSTQVPPATRRRTLIARVEVTCKGAAAADRPASNPPPFPLQDLGPEPARRRLPACAGWPEHRPYNSTALTRHRRARPRCGQGRTV